jgi:hypothetical protein
MRLLEMAGGVWRGARALFLALAIVLATGDSRAEEEKSAPETVRVEVVRQAVSVEVGDAALEEVLREVGRHAGFEVETRGDLGRARPQAFQGVPIDEGIRRLVGDNRVNLIMRYEVDQAGDRRLVEVDAGAAGEVPAEFLEQRRMRAELARMRVPPPPPPPPVE